MAIGRGSARRRFDTPLGRRTASQDEHDAAPSPAAAANSSAEDVSVGGEWTPAADEEECHTCMDPVERAKAVPLRCRHLFHHECMAEWARTQLWKGDWPSCPTCRLKMDTRCAAGLVGYSELCVSRLRHAVWVLVQSLLVNCFVLLLAQCFLVLVQQLIDMATVTLRAAALYKSQPVQVTHVLGPQT